MPLFYAADTMNFLRKVRARPGRQCLQGLVVVLLQPDTETAGYVGLTGIDLFRADHRMQPPLSGMPQRAARFLQPTGNLREDFFRAAIDGLPGIGLSDLLFSGGALYQSRFFGHGVVCRKERLVHHYVNQRAFSQ